MKTLVLALLFAAGVVPAAAAQEPATVTLDAREAPRSIYHVRLSMPVNGPTTLAYPKWIPGTHSASGQLGDLASLVVRSGSRTIPWHRDLVDGFAFHLDVPPGTTRVEVSFDVARSPGRSSTGALALLEWPGFVLYPRGTDVREYPIAADLILPAGWEAASALDVARKNGAEIDYAPATLERLVDSPVLAGANLRHVALAGGDRPSELAIASDLPAPTIDPKVVDHFRTLVEQAGLLFGARHWRHYTFLIALSDTIGFGGLEHGESSFNDTPQNGLASESDAKHYAGYLLAHEFAHSWNGKYRRPAGMVRGDLQQSYQTDLLWVYEGLTQYLGDVLATRSGFYSADEFMTVMAGKAANLGAEPGRAWRPLVDTAVAEDMSRRPGAEWQNQRRSVDYYFEGELIWLEADTILRARSGGTRSLDDFCRAFFGGADSGPSVVPYTRDDVVAALNAIVPYDWSGFFAQRIEAIAPLAPLGGIENAGWRVTYAEKPSKYDDFVPARRTGNGPDLRFSLGTILTPGGTVVDVLQGSPAAKAGLGAGSRIVAVDDRVFSPAVLTGAVASAKGSNVPLRLLVESADGRFATRAIDYHGGPRYPAAERDPQKPDVAASIVAPLKTAGK